MTEQARLNLMALREESTEGTLVEPSAATQFVPVREGDLVEPGIEVLANDELRGSLAPSQSQRGIENPSVEVPLYLKHSGSEGVNPNWAILLKSLFGTETENDTERAVTSGSTTAVLELAANGDEFPRGAGVLVKDNATGRNHSIRAIHSRSSNSLTMGFQLANAPASGVNLGLCTHYSPLNNGANPSFSAWHYIANRAAVEAVRGCRTDSLSMVAALGQEIEMNFTAMGLKYLFNPLIVTSSNQNLEFVDDGATQLTAVIPVGVYRNPHDLATAIQAAMTLVGEDVFTVVYSDSTGKFTIGSDGSTLSLLWKTGTTHGSDNADTHIGTLIGFNDAADDTGSTGTSAYTADSALSFVAAYSPTYDSAQPLVAKNMELMIGSASDNACLDATSFDLNLSNNLGNKGSFCSEGGVKNKYPTSRTSALSVVANLDQYDADKLRRYVDNVETRVQLSFGEKVNGNWVAGKCGYIYLASCTIDNHTISNEEGLAVATMELNGFADRSGNGEIYMGFL